MVIRRLLRPNDPVQEQHCTTEGCRSRGYAVILLGAMRLNRDTETPIFVVR